MRAAALLLALAAVPAAAQDADRGRLLYETQCGTCHYERVHQRPRERAKVQSLAQLRDEVYLRAGQTGRPFTLQDLSDLVAYLDRSYYGFAVKPAAGHELIYGAELMTPAEREQYRRDLAAAGEGKGSGLREQHRQRMRTRAKQRGVQLEDPEGTVRR
ncbi:MAG TPA: hypothetical protein VFV84_15265 [Burkholderiales bacterium]|nr:hypothetical protein [Burkholderiales bacterium]